MTYVLLVIRFCSKSHAKSSCDDDLGYRVDTAFCSEDCRVMRWQEKTHVWPERECVWKELKISLICRTTTCWDTLGTHTDISNDFSKVEQYGRQPRQMWRQDAVQINVPRIAAPSAERLVNLMSHFYQDTESEIKACAYPPPISPSSKLECKLGLMISFRYAPFLREHTAHFRQLEKRFCNSSRPANEHLFTVFGSLLMTRPSIIVINWESTCSLFPINLLVPSSLFFQRFHDGGSVWSDGPSIPRLPPC